MTRIVIFDLDGTIVDSVPYLTELAIVVCENLMPGVTEARRRYLECLGDPFGRQLEAMMKDCDLIVNQAARRQALNIAVELYNRAHRIMAPLFTLTELGRDLVSCRRDLMPSWKFALVSNTHKRTVMAMPQLQYCDFDRVYGYEGSPSTEKKEQMKRAIVSMGGTPHTTHIVSVCKSDAAIARELECIFWDARKPDVFNRLVKGASRAEAAQPWVA